MKTYREHAIAALAEMFPYQSTSVVRTLMNKTKVLLPAVKLLQKYANTRKTKRTSYESKNLIPRDVTCIELLKEKKYLELEDGIAQLKKQQRIEKETKMAEARQNGLLVECLCCYKEDCLEEEMVQCRAEHLYCKECVSTAAKVAMGNNKSMVECLGQCQEPIDWQQLSRTLDPSLLSKLIKKWQAEEVSEAGLEGLVSCPFCPYQTVMEGEADKVVVCRNPDCGRESCRMCKLSNHVPLRCDEVEKTEGLRKEIEEKLTEALVRECWKCKNKVFVGGWYY